MDYLAEKRKAIEPFKDLLIVSDYVYQSIVIGRHTNGNISVSDSAYSLDKMARWENIVEIRTAFNFGKHLPPSPSCSELHSGHNIQKYKLGCVMGVDSDGKIRMAGNTKGYRKREIRSWKNVMSICPDRRSIVVLCADGSIKGSPKYILDYNTKSWKDVVAVEHTISGSIGLRSDGTVVSDALGDINDILSSWRNIKEIRILGDECVAGIQNDGKIVCTDKKIKVSGWKNIVDLQIYRGKEKNGLIGLCADGTIRTTNKEDDLNSWHDIIDISRCGPDSFQESDITAGLMADGRVIVYDRKESHILDGEWHDIVAISASGGLLAGLHSDGKVVLKNYSWYGYDHPDVSKWNLLYE